MTVLCFSWNNFVKLFYLCILINLKKFNIQCTVNCTNFVHRKFHLNLCFCASLNLRLLHNTIINELAHCILCLQFKISNSFLKRMSVVLGYSRWIQQLHGRHFWWGWKQQLEFMSQQNPIPTGYVPFGHAFQNSRIHVLLPIIPQRWILHLPPMEGSSRTVVKLTAGIHVNSNSMEGTCGIGFYL